MTNDDVHEVMQLVREHGADENGEAHQFLRRIPTATEVHVDELCGCCWDEVQGDTPVVSWSTENEERSYYTDGYKLWKGSSVVDAEELFPIKYEIADQRNIQANVLKGFEKTSFGS